MSPSASSPSVAREDARESGGTSWRRTLGRIAVVAFFGLVAWLLYTQLRDVEWSRVATSMRDYSWTTLAACFALVVGGYLCYGSYDVLARDYTQHGLSRLQSLAIACVSYAFNLSLGPLIGGAGFRFRLYSRFGVPKLTIGRVLAFSIVTNWLGYMLLAGALFASGALQLPESWLLGGAALRPVGAGMLGVVAVYLWMCARHPGRTLRIRRFELELPSLKTAAMQLLASVPSWLLIGLILYLLMQREVALTTVLSVFLVSAITAAGSHIPGGLGVLEGVFIVLLGHRLDRSEILAALLVYRALYYIVPLSIAACAYLLLEHRARSESARSDPAASVSSKT